MALDPRTPVIVGAAQLKQHPEDDLSQAVEASRLMAEVVSRAVADSGNSELGSVIDWIGVVRGAWSYSDPARLVADQLGLDSVTTALTTMGGQAPQRALHSVCSQIQQGQLDCAVVTGAETIWSRRRLRRQGLELPTTSQDDATPDVVLGHELTMSTEFETERGVNQPVAVYPIFESAIRADNGETINEHRDRLGRLWHGFNQVAVANTYAWRREPMSADEIRNAGSSNRMVGFPYTKAMNSNWDLDQASAIVVCSAGKATSLGIATDRWVFPWNGSYANDTASISNRRDFHSSPAIAAAGRQLFELCQIAGDDINHIDLYSCFPSAVQIAARELGIDQQRPLTVTGGLTFAGGPLNNYVGHSLATMVDVIRDQGGIGLVTANGGYVTKHSLGLYRSDPPPTPFVEADAQIEAEKTPQTAVDPSFSGSGTIEAYTVMHDAGGPTHGIAAVLSNDDTRTWAKISDGDGLGQLMVDEGIGLAVTVDAEGTANLA